MPAWTRRGALSALASAIAAACGRTPAAPRYIGALSFDHGVASGDPGIDRVVIWTRVTPAQTGPVPVRWVVARDRGLTNVVQTGVIETSELRDYTVKADVTGLRAGAPYFYGFLAGEERSPVGKTRTLPQGRLDTLKLAVAACASHPHGFFNAYEAIARRDDVDLVVHLGDYIYEYGLSGFGGSTGVSLGRIPRPEIECISLADYRQRHAQYKAEPELQHAHAAVPWIVAWDDHEIADDAWSGGAAGHDPRTEGAWAVRKRAALQAYYEWMPIREPAPGNAPEAINRVFQFGDLMTLAMLETRLLARTQPFDYARDMPLYSTPWDFSNPQAPRAVSPSQASAPNVRMIPVPYEEIGGQYVPIWEWSRVQAATADPMRPPMGIRFAPDRARLAALLSARERTMLGAAQEQWLARQFTQSHQQGVAWQVLGNQSLLARALAPDLSSAPEAVQSALDAINPGASRLLFFTRFGLPISTESWDAYPMERARLLAILRQVAGNALVLSGDTRAAWANEVAAADGSRIAAEFGAPSVTAPGFGDAFASSGLDLDSLLVSGNPEVKWTDQMARGYLLLTLTKALATAEFFGVSTTASREFETRRIAGFTVRADDAPGVGALTPAAEADARN